MMRTETEYAEEVIRLAVVLTALTGTPGDESTYEYKLAERTLADHGHRIPESTLRCWVCEYPGYVSDANLIYDKAVHYYLGEIIDRGLQTTKAALKKLKAKLELGTDLSSSEIKQLMASIGIAFDKKKIVNGAKLYQENKAQIIIEFSLSSEDVIEPPNKRQKEDGSSAPH